VRRSIGSRVALDLYAWNYVKPDPAHTSHEAESDRHKHSLEIRLGSNIFRNTNGVIRVQGKEQLVLELAPDQERILLTIDLYDGSGNHVAHLRRNRWAFNDGNRFSLNTSESPPTLFPNLPWLKVTDQETGETVLEAAVAPGEKNPRGDREILFAPRPAHRNHVALLSHRINPYAVRGCLRGSWRHCGARLTTAGSHD
jgi:protocatechuate 3,4-dioxygenase beta subunit